VINYLIEHNRYLCLLGILTVLFIAGIFSKKRSKIDFKLVFYALLMQFGIGFAMLRLFGGAAAEGGGLHFFSSMIQSLYGFADQGVQFVFGGLANPTGPWGFVFAIKVLPIIIFFGALMSLLFYIGIVQKIVDVVGFVVRPILGTSGAETLCAVANSFLGQTEAPLLIRHYLAKMTKSEMFVVMVSGMTTVSGAIMAVYAAMGVQAQHVLVASLMAIPASILIAKIIYPTTEKSRTDSGASAEQAGGAKNIFDAISQGTVDGLGLALNVGAMLIVFISLMALVNALLGGCSSTINNLLGTNLPDLSMNLIFSYIFSPFAYLLGFTGEEAIKAAGLLGTKVTINELVAFGEMLDMQGLSDRTQVIMTYALCGFSNFSCIGIQVGGIGALVPERRAWLTELGLLAVLGSSLANLLSALMVAILI
jgi:CNT family concentrative nucleoside transporter